MIWRRLLLVLVIIAGVWGLYWPATHSLVVAWEDTDTLTYTHGYLVAAVAIWLLVRSRDELAAAPVQPCWPVALVLLVMGFVWLLAYRAGIQIVYQALLPVISWSAIYGVFGWRVARLCLFPLAFLYFAVPVWDLINPLAQWGTVFAVRFMLRLVGVPAYFHGDNVDIPAGFFHIAGGCSGLHYIIVGLTIAALIGELRRENLRGRLVLVGLALLMAAIANWVRVFTIIVAGHLTNMQHYLVSVDHYYFGWVIFGVGMLGYVLIVRRIGSDAEAPALQATQPTQYPRAIYTSGLAVLLALVTPTAWGWISGRAQPQSAAPDLLAKQVGEWSAVASSSQDWQPVFKNADVFVRQVYRAGDREVEAVNAVYLWQQQGRELGGYENSVTGELQTQDSRLQAVAGRSFVETIVADKIGRQSVIWHGYQVAGRWFTDATRAQLWYGLRSLAGAPVSSALMIRSSCGGTDCKAARSAVVNFIEQMRWEP